MVIVLMKENPRTFENFIVVWKIVKNIEMKYYPNYQISLEVIKDGIILRVDGLLPDKNFFRMKLIEMIMDEIRKGIVDESILDHIYIL